MPGNIVEFDFKNAELCWFCHKRRATKLCDFPTGVVTTSLDFKPVRTTCSRAMCDKCATSIDEEVDFCPHCMKMMNKKTGR